MPETTTSVLIIGFDPAVVDYDKWPGLTAEKLLLALRADEAKLRELGYDASICFIDRGEAAERLVRERLDRRAYDCILVGAGVRADPEHLLLFERLLNLLHEQAPQAKICFNSGPFDTVDAVRRWV